MVGRAGRRSDGLEAAVEATNGQNGHSQLARPLAQEPKQLKGAPLVPPPSLPPPSLPPPCRTNRLLALALDQPADYFDAKFSHPTCTLRPIHYTAEGSDPNNGLFAAGALRARTGWGTHLPACRATRMGLLMMRSTAMPLLMAQ